MSKQLKKITNRVLSACMLCREMDQCKKLVGIGCKYFGGSLDPEKLRKETN
jgi:hypothetical protein